MFRPLIAAISAVFFAATANVAAAEIRAVLVGVSDYDDSIGLADLRGPANDVRLLQDVLTRRGLTAITVLADGVEGGSRPTRAAILGALADEAARAEPDDFIYIHLSGHGTQQRDHEQDETDGLDEVFLPADTARAEPGSGVIPNAIVDDEIGMAVDAIRAKGAHVWLVLDSCHSGSGLRAADAGSASRYVDPALLGISVTAEPGAQSVAVEPPDPDLPGGFMAFYAARSDELAREANMAPEGADEEWYGLFSSKLAARLDQTSGESFRQLFQAVLSDLNDSALPGVARLQTPSWDGSLIDATVFGGTDTVGVRRFAVTGDELSAGLVHGIGDGTLMALFADATDPADAVLGYAQTSDAKATLSYLAAVGEDCQPRVAAACDSAGVLPANARFAQVVGRPVDLTVTVAPPRTLADGTPLTEDHPAYVALAEGIAASPDATGGFALKLDPVAFEIETIWDGSRLWFGRRAALGDQPAGLDWTPGKQDLLAILQRIGQAETLARMLGTLEGGGSFLNPSPIELSANMRATRIDDMARPGQNIRPLQECRAAIGQIANDPLRPMDVQSDLKQCDQLFFSARGLVDGARDVNRVHIDAQYCIHAKYARIEGMSAARQLGPEMTVCSDCPGGTYSAGDERLFVIVTENAENAEALKLEGLVENCLAGGGTRGAAEQDAMSFIETLARRPDTRGAFGSVGISNIWVERRDWTVQPREEVFRKAGITVD